MTERSAKADADFTLFDSEDRVLEHASTIIDGLEETTDLIKTLTAAYKRAVKDQKRMVRLCDRMQEELIAVKERLGRRSQSPRGTRRAIPACRRLRTASRRFSIAAIFWNSAITNLKRAAGQKHR